MTGVSIQMWGPLEKQLKKKWNLKPEANVVSKLNNAFTYSCGLLGEGKKHVDAHY